MRADDTGRSRCSNCQVWTPQHRGARLDVVLVLVLCVRFHLEHLLSLETLERYLRSTARCGHVVERLGAHVLACRGEHLDLDEPQLIRQRSTGAGDGEIEIGLRRPQ